MTDFEPYRQTIAKAIRALGSISLGNQVDLLLDNHPELRNSTHARQVLMAMYAEREKRNG